MKLVLQYSTTDGATHTVTTNIWVITQWERKYRRKASDLAQGIGIEDLAFLAYEGSKVYGITVPAEFDLFVKRLESIDVLDAEQPNPTDAAPTDGN